MEHHLADQGLLVTCLNDPSRIEEYDHDCAFANLWHGGVANALLPWHGWFQPEDQDVVVLVSGRTDKQCLGLLAASRRTTGREPFLLLEAAYVIPAARGRNLLQRMAAFALLSAARLDTVPLVLAACVQDADYRDSLHDLRRHFTGAAMFPRVDTGTIELAMAGLARRIARVVRPGARYDTGSGTLRAFGMDQALVVLDLTASDEARILQDARRLYRARRRVPAKATQ